jgi:lincosamide nucleotidyltransferase A/C/D/E
LQRNPVFGGGNGMKPEMTSSALVELLHSFDDAGIEVWLDGGWGVDALVGEQTRSRRDVDVIVRVSALAALRHLLLSRGFSEGPGGTPSNFVLAHSSGLDVDVHAVTFDANGNGVYRMANGTDWVYPAEGFGGRGVVNGRAVRCLSPTTQVLCHADGYVPTEKDLHDMALLERRFGVELPSHLRSGGR